MKGNGEIQATKDGEKIVLSDHGGLVILHFDGPREYVALHPSVAIEMAEKLARQSYRAVNGDFPTTMSKSMLTEQLRIKLRNRVEIMIRSMQGNGDEPKIQATRVVDEVLKAVA